MPMPSMNSSVGQSMPMRRTRRMADGALDLTLKLLGLAKLAVLKPVRTRVLSLLREAELLPESEATR